MKKKLILILCAIPFIALSNVNRNPTGVVIDIKNKPTHSEVGIPADMPDVYYDDVNGVITIVDYANATYYVTIYDDWWNAVITDTKVGGGTINVSSLSPGDYVIEITTSWNNQYEGTFTVP